MNGEQSARKYRWLAPAVVFLAVLAAQLWLVAAIGTDIPFQDQWDVEGRELYPAARDGSLRMADLFRAHNEHRIVWTQGLNLLLFRVNGQWDPLVQLAANAVLHAALAAALAGMLARNRRARDGWIVAIVVTLACLPLAGWHNVVWGFQSQVYFAVLFGLLAFANLAEPGGPRGRQVLGWLGASAALFAMGPGALVPVALLGLAVLRVAEAHRFDRTARPLLGPALLLVGAAWLLRTDVPGHESLRATSLSQYITAVGRLLAWPHVAQPLAALVMNLPLAIIVWGRLRGWRRPAASEDVVVLLGGWSILVAFAAAWTRGGSDEFAFGVPSRYVDFMVLLPLANACAAATLVGEASAAWRMRARLFAAVWSVFLAVGWIGLSAEVMRGIIGPRARDREAPVRLVRAFQATGDAAVFSNQPRLLVPHPNPESVRAVLNDPRMRGALPPSLQLGQPMGPLSRAVRWLLGRQ